MVQINRETRENYENLTVEEIKKFQSVKDICDYLI